MKPRIVLKGKSPLQSDVNIWRCHGDGVTGIYTSGEGYSPKVAYQSWLRVQTEMTMNTASYALPYAPRGFNNDGIPVREPTWLERWFGAS